MGLPHLAVLLKITIERANQAAGLPQGRHPTTLSTEKDFNISVYERVPPQKKRTKVRPFIADNINNASIALMAEGNVMQFVRV